MKEHRSNHAAWTEENAQLLQQLVFEQLTQSAVVFMDSAGTITGWNEGAYRLTGFKAEEVLGQSLALLFTPEDQARELHVHELNSARLMGSAEDERWHMRKDGSRLWASGLTLPLGTGTAPRGFAKMFRDTTHLRLRLDALEDEVRALKKEQQHKNLFLVTIAHELRNPLQPLTTATALLSQPIDAALRDRATKILQRQIRVVEHLVEDLIDMTRVSHGAMRIAYEHVPLQPLLEEAVESCRAAAERKQITLVYVLPPVQVTVQVDPGRIAQVVTNLLTNAIKFTPPRGHVALQANLDESHFIVKVKDTGKGIGPALQPRIFDMFTQAEGADTGRGKGLGIGLALVKEIVSLHGGSVEVKSEGEHKGSEFFIRVPLAKPLIAVHGPPQ